MKTLPPARESRSSEVTADLKAPNPTASAKPGATLQSAAAGVVDVWTSAVPERINALKAAVLEISRANTLRTDNLAEVRARLEPLVAELATYFAANRPDDELVKLRGTWKSVWFDNTDITDRGPAKLRRDRVFQVVQDGFYYNASDYGLFGGTVSTFLRGDYTIEKRATPENRGQQGLNVVRLTFGETRLRTGALPDDGQVAELTLKVASRDVGSIPTPGPKGIQGRLWNLYLDDSVRISVGYSDSKPDRLDYYVLTRVADTDGVR